MLFVICYLFFISCYHFLHGHSNKASHMSLGFSPDSIIISIRSSIQASTNLQQICEDKIILCNGKLTKFLPQITRGNLHRDFPGHGQSEREKTVTRPVIQGKLPDPRFQGGNHPVPGICPYRCRRSPGSWSSSSLRWETPRSSKARGRRRWWWRWWDPEDLTREHQPGHAQLVGLGQL